VEELAPDIAEAIRLSLLDENPSSQEFFPFTNSIPIKYGKGAKADRRRSLTSSPSAAESSNRQEIDDLEFAIQLSLAEEQSREQAAAAQEEQFPAFDCPPSRPPYFGNADEAKGKARAY